MTKPGNAGQQVNVGAPRAPKVHSGHFARTQRAGRRRAPIGPVIARAFVLLVLVGACFVVAPGKADAQTTYYYRGNNFNLFTCAGNSLCSNPTAGETTYTTSDYVFASMTVGAPLSPNLKLATIYYSGTGDNPPAGFSLTMQDGQQTLTSSSSYNSNLSVVAEVSTDASGNITNPWWVQMCVISTNACISTVNNPGNGAPQDYGSPGSSVPTSDAGYILSTPGAWFQKNSGTATSFDLQGEVYGFPFGPFYQTTGGGNTINSTQWNFEIPSAWTYGHGQLNSTGSSSYLSAGAYVSTAGPCSPGGIDNTCNTATGAARGLA